MASLGGGMKLVAVLWSHSVGCSGRLTVGMKVDFEQCSKQRAAQLYLKKKKHHQAGQGPTCPSPGLSCG
jgi:hypothetical protein